MQSQEEFLNDLFKLSVPLISLELNIDETRICDSENLSKIDHEQVEKFFFEIFEKYWFRKEEELKDSKQ